MNRHVATWNGCLYDIFALRLYAEQLPVETIATEEFRPGVGKGNTYWSDKKHRTIGPAEFLHDWPAAQENPDWREHTQKVREADLSFPIWLAPDGTVLDGVHRLTKAFLEGVTQIQIRRFMAIPEWAIVS